MEARLKADVLREAAAGGGRLLVAREQTRAGDPEAGSEIIDVYEPIAGTCLHVLGSTTLARWHALSLLTELAGI